MSEKPKINIDELITLYLDGEATERQRTELKRMILHNPSIGDKLKSLQRQQRAMGALPVESAPESLIDDIRAELERKLILGDFAQTDETVAGKSHLLARRALTTAAMLLIPMGLLFVVVWQIMKPPQEGGMYVSTSERIAQADPGETSLTPTAQPDETRKTLPFNGVLVLKTDEYMTVSRQMDKAIQAKGLIAQTLKSGTADVTRFQITASPKKIAGLLDVLAAVRPRCKEVVLKVTGAENTNITIDNPQDRQLKMLVYEDNIEMLNHLAARYASANLKDDSAVARGDDEPAAGTDGYPGMSMPQLAGSYDQMQNTTIELTIYIERNYQ